jgi:hypothetical protein
VKASRPFLLLLASILVLAAVGIYVAQPVTSAQLKPGAIAADAARLERDVRAISTSFGPRDYRHPENLDRIAAFVRDEFTATGARVSEQRFPVDGVGYGNVIASFGPEHGERVVVGAHYDTFGPAPGADDNASGVAGALELARMLGNSDVRGRVDLVAFTLEEPPWFSTQMMGSAVHAKSLKDNKVAVRAMFSLEMIGYFFDAPGSQEYPNRVIALLYPSTGNFIAVIGNIGGGSLVRRIKSAMASATDLPVYSLNAPRFVTGVDFSDHASYWDAGYPAVMITDTAFLRNRAYHTMQDTADRLDYGRMAKVVTGVHAAVIALTQAQ